MVALDPISQKLSALADPTRRAILSRLSRGEASVTELAEPFDMTMPAITKHLKVLERAGLIERRREAQKRPCVLVPSALDETLEWLEKFREQWESNFNRLDAVLEQLKRDHTTEHTQGRDQS
ncbi:MAG: winged helix-turn-helix transcriptional regulator [Phycisphaeraceae bacterium]|nr:winged helix-turn-helix transcriptional regulator [Phycisphaerales bacterium]MCB9859206.1 winged helix-turn-helix transcriptional regulator [Phycisphaeraceae bacterium]